MDARYISPGYAYTPVLGEKSVYIADVQIDGKPHRFKLRANDTFETWQVICRHLKIPFRMQA